MIPLKSRFTIPICVIAGLAGFICLYISLSSGAVNISFSDMVNSFFSKSGPDLSIRQSIFLKIRFPRAISAFLCGGILGLAGLVFQCLLKNPLADPYVLGISAGSALGAVIAMSAGFTGIIGVSASAFVGGLATVALVMSAAAKRFESTTLITAGIMINASLSSVVSLMVYMSPRIKSVMFWLMGSFSSAGMDHAIGSAFMALFFVIIIWCVGPWMDALSMGEITAASLGVPVKRLRIFLFILASVCTAAVVSFYGIIGFVGLMVPHFTRSIAGASHRRATLPAFFIGAGFICLCDTLARTIIAPEQLPIGIITGIIGGPFFIFLLVSGKRGSVS